MVSAKFLLGNLALASTVLGASVPSGCGGVREPQAVAVPESNGVKQPSSVATANNAAVRPTAAGGAIPTNVVVRPTASAAAVVRKPSGTKKPAATKPAATKPAATKPAATKPAATKPAATKPATSVKPAPTGTSPKPVGGKNPISNIELGAKWDICIHKPIKHDSVADIIPKDGKVLDIDMMHAVEFPNMIPMIKKAGKAVICYFNAGAVQVWDTDKDAFPSSVTGTSLGGAYVGEEFYVDIRSQTVVDIMKKRLDLAVSIGCDAVDPDNIDAWADNGSDPTGFNLTPEDYVTYLTKLADHAHSLTTKSGGPLLVGQKNAGRLAPALSPVLDFAVLESCRDWSFCKEFQTYISKGKHVFSIQYPKSIPAQGSLNAADKKKYCEETTAQHGDANFSNILKFASEQLDGWSQMCGEASYNIPYAAW